MRVRLADIAERAGVSQATVSRVLSGKPVSDATRESVLIAVDVLGYERPVTLRRRAAGLVGLVVPETTDLAFPQFTQAMDAVLAPRGYTMMLRSLASGVPERDHVTALLDQGAAGIVFVGGRHALVRTDVGRYVRLRERGMPLVLVNGYQARVDAPAISVDDATAVDLAVTHLVELGHRQIGLALGPSGYTSAQRRTEQFRAVMRRLVPDVEPRRLVQHTCTSVEGGTSAGRELLAVGVTAVVAASDLMALGVVRAASQAGLRVPADVSVVGSGDSVTMPFTDPPLTTVREDVTAMGTAAAQALLDEIDHVPHSRIEALFPPELVVRGSTARTPSR